jgi:hypothetical protein
MPRVFGPKTLKLKRGDVRLKSRGFLTALVWNDRRQIYVLTNIDTQPAQGNFCDSSIRPGNLQIVERYKRLMCFVESSVCMVNSPAKIRHNLKWTTKLLFHRLDQTVLNISVLLSSSHTSGEE